MSRVVCVGRLGVSKLSSLKSSKRTEIKKLSERLPNHPETEKRRQRKYDLAVSFSLTPGMGYLCSILHNNISSMLFELGPVCWPEMLMRDPTVVIQNRLLIRAPFTLVSPKMQHNFEINCNPTLSSWHPDNQETTDNNWARTELG